MDKRWERVLDRQIEAIEKLDEKRRALQSAIAQIIQPMMNDLPVVELTDLADKLVRVYPEASRRMHEVILREEELVGASVSRIPPQGRSKRSFMCQIRDAEIVHSWLSSNPRWEVAWYERDFAYCTRKLDLGEL